MKLSFRLDTQDYLDYQLYTVSRSEKAMRKRLIGRLLFPIIYLLVGIIFIIDKNWKGSIQAGKLGDLAPTILTMMELPIPKEMTGTVLI
jgi:hypothetical protein